MTNVRFKDRIHLTQVLYVGKGLKDNDPVRGQRRGCGCESPLQVGEEGGGRREKIYWESQLANICQIVIFIIRMVLFDPAAILQ